MAARDVAVIDIGSNSVRLVLYRLEGRAVWPLYNEKVLAGLGRDLSATGRLSPDGVVASMKALRRFAAVLEGVRPEHTLVAATAAVREAEDGQAFCERVAAETGLFIRVLSGEDEAHYAAMGVANGAPGADGVSADMGGASLELTRIDHGQVGKGVTLALGAFSFGAKGFDARKVREQADRRLGRVAADFRTRRLYAVGGAWRSLAQVHMAMGAYPLKVVHQYAIPAREARDAARFLARQSKGSLDAMPGVSRKRAETLPFAAVVLDSLIDQLGLEEIEFSAWGVREGLLYDWLSDRVDATDPLLAGCAALGVRQGVSSALPGALQGWIDGLIRPLPPIFSEARDAQLAAAACNLADLGARLHPDHRVELTFDQVLRAPIAGQTHSERCFLAAAINARYGGPTATPEPATIERLLDDTARRRARVLGLAIRLACDLSGRSPNLLANARARVEDGALKLTAAEGFADVLLGEQTRRRAKALAEAMDLPLAL
ncbi:MAG: Ppx/GppA family phosphatase [Brevundimonas sp.]|nr:MAG: Ppx/GppA family phosphatase [Brevundimonas sp.]